MMNHVKPLFKYEAKTAVELAFYRHCLSRPFSIEAGLAPCAKFFDNAPMMQYLYDQPNDLLDTRIDSSLEYLAELAEADLHAALDLVAPTALHELVLNSILAPMALRFIAPTPEDDIVSTKIINIIPKQIDFPKNAKTPTLIFEIVTTEQLNQAERDELADYLHGQYLDGWGENGSSVFGEHAFKLRKSGLLDTDQQQIIEKEGLDNFGYGNTLHDTLDRFMMDYDTLNRFMTDYDCLKSACKNSNDAPDVLEFFQKKLNATKTAVINQLLVDNTQIDIDVWFNSEIDTITLVD